MCKERLKMGDCFYRDSRWETASKFFSRKPQIFDDKLEYIKCGIYMSFS